MPSNSSKKKDDKTAAEPTTEGSAAVSVVSEERVDLLDALQVGEPGLPPVPVKLLDVEFSINRHYSPQTIWRWSDLTRMYTLDLPATATAAERAKRESAVEEVNRKILQILLPEPDHDKIDALLTIVADRSIPEARRILTYINNLAGLTDKLGNPLAP